MDAARVSERGDEQIRPNLDAADLDEPLAEIDLHLLARRRLEPHRCPRLGGQLLAAGGGFFESLRQGADSIPVLMLSALADPSDRIAGLTAEPALTVDRLDRDAEWVTMGFRVPEPLAELMVSNSLAKFAKSAERMLGLMRTLMGQSYLVLLRTRAMNMASVDWRCGQS
mgnify:CR=1 FL=1